MAQSWINPVVENFAQFITSFAQSTILQFLNCFFKCYISGPGITGVHSMCPDITHSLTPVVETSLFSSSNFTPSSPVPSFSLTFPPVLALAYTFACLIQNHDALKCIDSSTLQCKTRPRHCWQLQVYSTACSVW